MTMNSRKMNNYSSMRVSTVLVLTIVLVTSTFAFPMGTRTGATPISNNPPYVPSNPGPANGSTNVSVYADLNWTGGDPDNDTVTYDVFFGTAIPLEKVVTNQSWTMYDPGVMNYSTLYYWMIIAWDNQSNSTTGPQWEFTTKSNVPPNTPSDPSPANGSTNVSATMDLTWAGGDPDGDPVTYDVYFGTMSPPNKVVANQSATMYDPGLMNYSTLYYWMIIARDNQNTSAIGPQWEFTTGAKPNNPPNKPNSPIPANAATNVLLNATLSWSGGDPDGDPVTYDVYFGTTSTPPKLVSNQSTLSYNPGVLTYDTTYYWKIIAWDNHSASTTGPLWHFTTKQGTPITVSITKPKEKTLYFQNQEKTSLPKNTIIYGPITITVNASAQGGIARVEFYVDGKLKKTLTTAPYEYLWQPFIQFNGLSLKHTIKVIAYDNNGNNASTELNVTKWRFHPLPFIVAGITIASAFILHTTVRGLIFNLKESKIGVSFYAIRTHYNTVGPLRSARGVINFKSCMGGILIGPMKLVRFGPFHKFAYGSFTVLGNIHYDTRGFGGGLGQSLIKLLLQSVQPK
jgi:hypothetical protein